MTITNFKTLFSSKETEWETPKELFDKLNKEFNFTLDFCASKENYKCNKYYSKDDDALKQNPINEIIFCNPPYGKQIKLFVKKLYELSKNNTIVLLIPARTDTMYFHEYIYNKAELRFIKGRLKFGGKQNGSGSAPFPSMLVIYHNNKEASKNSKGDA